MALSTIMCFSVNAEINQSVIQQTIRSLSAKDASNDVGIEKGVRQAASLWQVADGSDQDFQKFCETNYIADPIEKEHVFLKISDYMEAINGYYNQMTLRLQQNMHLTTGPLYPIDEMFASYSPSSHLTDDFFTNKIAFIIMLNFPHLTLVEKEALGNDRKAWAYARLGDMFTQRIPADVLQKQGNAMSDAEMYISAYNIYMGYTTNKEGKVLFSKEMVLLSHWNLRDEIKSNYNKGKIGLDKQRTIYEIMKRIIAQEIPVEVINAGKYMWNPFTNTIMLDGKFAQASPESTTRYQKMVNTFKAMQGIDKYTGDTYIDRKFNDEMEISLKDAESLFDSFLSAPELKILAKMISKRLGRKLEAYDIWYDGFKARSNMDEVKLNEQTRFLYPNADAMKNDLPNILMKAGFSKDKANYIAAKVAVDPARGSGHAWGSAMKGQQSHLRTRIPATGMDYKGYNIAIHEFGHNVEQTISMYDVDYYMMSGVPNTAFTEALAFVFQKRDLEFLGIKDSDPEKKAMDVLDKVWTMYEITGVSMVDISVWKWLYAHPDATAEQLKEATISIAKEIWNKYYAPVFGVKDETILAVYSHMIDSPLYLSAYAFGQIIEFQLSQYLEGKNFATEVERIFSQGRLTPNAWMKQATGSPLNVEPMLEAVRKVVIKK